MLILRRTVGERIFVGDIVVTLVRVGRGKARIGIDAPKDVPIRREEVAANDDPTQKIAEGETAAK